MEGTIISWSAPKNAYLFLGASANFTWGHGCHMGEARACPLSPAVTPLNIYIYIYMPSATKKEKKLVPYDGFLAEKLPLRTPKLIIIFTSVNCTVLNSSMCIILTPYLCKQRLCHFFRVVDSESYDLKTRV